MVAVKDLISLGPQRLTAAGNVPDMLLAEC
jgi:hypothetical protein